MFGKHGATRHQFHHKSDSGSVRSQPRTRSADLVTCSTTNAAYPGLVPLVSAEPDLLPYLPAAFLNSPTGFCYRKSVTSAHVKPGVGCTAPPSRATTSSERALKKKCSYLDIAITPDPLVLGRIRYFSLGEAHPTTSDRAPYEACPWQRVPG